MSLLKVNEVQNYNGSSLTLTASTVSTSAQLNTGGNISVTGSINVSDDSTTRSNLGLGSIATQNANAVAITGGSLTGTEIDLKSSGATIYKSDGTTAILSESSGTVTLANVNLSSSVGHGYTTILKKTFSVLDSTNTTLTFTSSSDEQIDELDWHSTSLNTDRITVDRNGIYLMTLSAFDIDCSNRAIIDVLHHNSSTTLLNRISQDISATTIDDLAMSSLLKMSSGDYLRAIVFHTDGATQDFEIIFGLTLIKEL